MRVLICGHRDFNDLKLMKEVLYNAFDPDDTVILIHGNARGADRLSEQALTGYFHGGFEVIKFNADWNKYGLAAGPIRNKQMIDEVKPDMGIAFLAEGSKGTKNMIKQLQDAGIPVTIINV